MTRKTRKKKAASDTVPPSVAPLLFSGIEGELEGATADEGAPADEGAAWDELPTVNLAGEVSRIVTPEDLPTVNLTGAMLDALARDDGPVGDPDPHGDAVTEPRAPSGAADGGEAPAATAEGVDAAGEDGVREASADPAKVDAEDGEAPGEVEEARDLTRDHLRGLLEALIFASDKPVKSGELSRLASARIKEVRELLAELKVTYARRGIVLDEVAGGWLFRTSVQYAPFVRELSSEKPVRLTRAQVETLAIAAYRQPITRPEIDDIRGVDSGATLKLLLERGLVRILGKKDEPGRPILYGTTTAFLEFFGLKSLKDLPTLKEFTELSDESRRTAEAELGDVLPEVTRHAEPTPHAGDTLAPPTDHDTIAPPATPSAPVPSEPRVDVSAGPSEPSLAAEEEDVAGEEASGHELAGEDLPGEGLPGDVLPGEGLPGDVLPEEDPPEDDPPADAPPGDEG